MMRHKEDRDTVRTVARALIVAGLSLSVVVVGGMLYLSRGTYDPADALVLVMVGLAAWACPVCLAAGVVIRIVTVVAAARDHGRASGRARARDRPDTVM